MELIDKAAVLARIEEEIKEYSKAKKEYPTCEEYYEGALDVLEDFRDNFLNTLEVKEVDFEKEWKEYFKYRGDMATINIIHLAKHFFELGLNARKGE